MKKNSIIFELTEDKGQIYIFGDSEGLKRFANDILNLINKTSEGTFSDEHFFSPNWGGDYLSEEQMSESGEVINHVKVYCFKGDKYA